MMIADGGSIKISTSAEFLDNLILQRTAEFIALGGGAHLGQWFRTGAKQQLSAYLIENQLIESYCNALLGNVGREVGNLCRQVGRLAFDNVVSVGPGSGIFELLLLKRISFSRVTLIDIEESPGLHQHGYSQAGAGYASLGAIVELLTANGIPPEKIVACNPNKSSLPSHPFDLFISCLSMGFHYPCDAYLNFIMENAGESAIVVLDKRKGVPDRGFAMLEKLFTVFSAEEHPKHHRLYMLKAA